MLRVSLFTFYLVSKLSLEKSQGNTRNFTFLSSLWITVLFGCLSFMNHRYSESNSIALNCHFHFTSLSVPKVWRYLVEFSRCCDKMLNKSNGRQVCLGSQFEGPSWWLSVVKLYWEKHETPSHLLTLCPELGWGEMFSCFLLIWWWRRTALSLEKGSSNLSPKSLCVQLLFVTSY